MPTEDFERHIEETKAEGKELTTATMLVAARQSATGDAVHVLEGSVRG